MFIEVEAKGSGTTNIKYSINIKNIAYVIDLGKDARIHFSRDEYILPIETYQEIMYKIEAITKR